METRRGIAAAVACAPASVGVLVAMAAMWAGPSVAQPAGGAEWSTAGAVPPPDFDIPREIATRILSGYHTRIVVIGDEAACPILGSYGGGNATPFSIGVGMANWSPLHGWRGLHVAPSIDPYVSARGVGAQGWGTALIPRVDGSDFPDDEVGWVIGTAVSGHWSASLRCEPSDPHATVASRAIARGTPRVRHLVYENELELMTATRSQGFPVAWKPSGTGWTRFEYPLGGPFSTWNPDNGPFTTTVTGPAITGGSYFFDSASAGMSIVHIAHEGDQTLDHLRTEATYGMPGWYTSRARGYESDGLLSWLEGHESTAGVIVVVYLGKHAAQPDNGGASEISAGLATAQYGKNIIAIIARWRALLEPEGFLLIAPYAGASGALRESRARLLYQIQQTSPLDTGFVDLPAMMDMSNSAWLVPGGSGLSSAGAFEAARCIWHACEASVCKADFNLDLSLDSADFFAYIEAYGRHDPRADLDSNGEVDAADFFEFLRLYGQGC